MCGRWKSERLDLFATSPPIAGWLNGERVYTASAKPWNMTTEIRSGVFSIFNSCRLYRRGGDLARRATRRDSRFNITNIESVRIQKFDLCHYCELYCFLRYGRGYSVSVKRLRTVMHGSVYCMRCYSNKFLTCDSKVTSLELGKQCKIQFEMYLFSVRKF